MKLLIINPYDYKTVQSNPGLLSLLRILENKHIDYSLTVSGATINDGFKYVEMPQKPGDPGIERATHLNSRQVMNDLTHLVAVDPEGAVIAMRLLDLSKRRGIRCSYISYEILFKDEIILPWEQQLKEADLAYLRLCKEILIQDNVRGRMFLDEMGMNLGLHYAPIAPLQYFGKSPNRDVIRKTLGLPLDKTILVYSGSFEPYAKPDWWVKIAENLPKNYVFILTCFDSMQYRTPVAARVVHILSRIGNTLFVPKELPYDKYMQLLSVCDVGLALFRPAYRHWADGRNIRQMGLSSGKFCNYVSCGLPVICDSNQDKFHSLATSYPVIQTVTTSDEILSKLKVLSEPGFDVDACCKKLFDEALNPRSGIETYLEALHH